MSQITIHVTNKNDPIRIHKVNIGLSLMEALRDLGYSSIQGVCGGSMACATCHVYIPDKWTRILNLSDNEKSPEEDDILEMCDALKEDSRLSCQICLTEDLDGLEIFLP